MLAGRWKNTDTNTLALEGLAKKYPSYADQLIQPVLLNLDEFKRLFKSMHHLEYLRKTFPKNKILNQPTLEEALKLVEKNSIEMRAKIEGTTVGALAGGSLSQHLPPEVSTRIGSFLDYHTGSKLARTHKHAHDTAAKNKLPSTSSKKK